MARKTVMNVFATEENMAKVNPKSIRLLDEWCIYLRTINRSPKTIYNYRSDINIFLVWLMLNRDNKFFVDVTKKDIMFFQDYLMNELNLGSCRVRRLKDTLSSFSNYIENMCDEEYPDFRNIVRKIESPSVKNVREKTILTDDDVKVMFDGLLERGMYQASCALALALYSGSRKAELLEFKTHYFDDENVIFGSLYKTPETIKTKGRDGGKYINKYVLKKQFERYLFLWKRERKRNKIDENAGEIGQYLFVSNYHGNWKRTSEAQLNTYAKVITDILKENGIEKEFYWHCCRHYFTTFLKRSDIPSEVVQQIVGWSSADLVDLYDDRDKDEELGKYFNEKGIVKREKKSITEL